MTKRKRALLEFAAKCSAGSCRRGRSICLLRPPLEIECQTNSREIDEHTPVHSDTPRAAGKVAFQALGTRHILTNVVLSLSKRCG